MNDVPVSQELLQSIADEAAVHKETLIRRIAGLAVRPRGKARIDAAIARRGLFALIAGR